MTLFVVMCQRSPDGITDKDGTATLTHSIPSLRATLVRIPLSVLFTMG